LEDSVVVAVLDGIASGDHVGVNSQPKGKVANENSVGPDGHKEQLLSTA
jgi:hypothetical protein